MLRFQLRRRLAASGVALLLLAPGGLVATPLAASAPHRVTSLRVAPPRADAAGAAHGGRAEHCALSLGVLVGAALGSWSNPVVGLGFVRLGMHLVAMHC